MSILDKKKKIRKWFNMKYAEDEKLMDTDGVGMRNINKQIIGQQIYYYLRIK